MTHINHHPITQLLIWAAPGRRVKDTDLDEADVPTGVRPRVRAAVPPIQRIWATGDQAGASAAAAQAAADIVKHLPAGHGPAREPLSDDPRELAARVHR